MNIWRHLSQHLIIVAGLGSKPIEDQLVDLFVASRQSVFLALYRNPFGEFVIKKFVGDFADAIGADPKRGQPLQGTDREANNAARWGQILHINRPLTRQTTVARTSPTPQA
jgi:hypothetical protein